MAWLFCTLYSILRRDKIEVAAERAKGIVIIGLGVLSAIKGMYLPTRFPVCPVVQVKGSAIVHPCPSHHRSRTGGRNYGSEHRDERRNADDSKGTDAKASPREDHRERYHAVAQARGTN